jgi:hypothetical protein
MVVYGTWYRISPVPATVYPAPCSADRVFGTYVLWQHGYVIPPPSGSTQPTPAPGSSVAIGSIGRDGSASAAGTVTIAGQVLPFGSAGGSIQAKADCTGSMTLNVESQGRTLGPVQGYFIALDGGDTLWTMELSSPMGKPITLGTMKRISHTTGTGQ